MYIHLVAHSIPPSMPLTDPIRARWLWRKLRERFPDASAAVLMSNHLQMVVNSGSPEQSRTRLADLLAAFTRVHGIGWSEVPSPSHIKDRQKLWTDIRYIALNPCRAGLCRDPLLWPWSTYRGLFGAVWRPWVAADRLRDTLGSRSTRFPETFHRFVSSDPSTALTGTSLPTEIARPSPLPRYTLPQIAAAVASALESDPLAVRQRSLTRRVYLQLARELGWTSPSMLAATTGITESGVWRAVNRAQHPALAAARMCLADARLRAPFGINDSLTSCLEEGVIAARRH